jgi:predicted MFS family arabinose efflux permease
VAPRFTGLWRHRDFLFFWGGQSVSIFGALITNVALSFTAVLVLNASAIEMGMLRVASTLPGFLAGLAAGAWVDRLRRRPILIATDLGRALLLATVPLASLLGVLSMGQLFVVAFLAGTLTVIFEVAYQSYLPRLVAREQLVEGNSKLRATDSIAEVAGFGLAGVLVQILTAPIAILVDVATYLVSAVSLALIRTKEPPAGGSSEQPSILREIGEGLRLVSRQRLLAPTAGAAATLSLAMGMIGAVYILYLTRELKIDPAVQGVLFSVGGVSALVGAVVAGRAAHRWGLGRTLIVALVLNGVGNLCIPLAGGPLAVALFFLVVHQLLADGAFTVYTVNVVSLRQAITPDRLQGRMSASIEFIVWTGLLAGSVAGGILGELVGARATLTIAGSTALFATLWVIFSPLSRLREQPTAGNSDQPEGAS